MSIGSEEFDDELNALSVQSSYVDTYGALAEAAGITGVVGTETETETFGFREFSLQNNLILVTDTYRESTATGSLTSQEIAEALGEQGIDYHWLESLGGHRNEGLADSPNFGIRESTFGNYADHMLSDEFRDGIDRLLAIANTKRTAIMCAEKSFHDCHRKLTSDSLVAGGALVQHILADGTLEPHKLSEGTRLGDGKVTYPESHPLFDKGDS